MTDIAGLLGTSVAFIGTATIAGATVDLYKDASGNIFKKPRKGKKRMSILEDPFG